MLRQRPSFARIVVLGIALAAGSALLQITRHRLQANDASARNAAGAAKRPDASACTSARAPLEPPHAASAAPDRSPVTLRLDYAGAEALVDALAKDSLSDADVDSLLRIRGLCAMVDNVSRFFPEIGVAEFRKDIQAFARTKKGGDFDDYFQLSGVWQARSRIHTLIAAIRMDDRKMVEETIG